jgi:hypothetical protein
LTWLSRIAAVSPVANLFITYLSELYAVVKAPFMRAAALPALQKKQPDADRFRLPFGTSIAALALLITGVLMTRMHLGELTVISTTAVIALANWLWT